MEDVVEGSGLGWIGVGTVGGEGCVGGVAEGSFGWSTLGWALVDREDALRVGVDRLETVGCGRRPKP